MMSAVMNKKKRCWGADFLVNNVLNGVGEGYEMVVFFCSRSVCSRPFLLLSCY
jgi:hypothetical protein